MIFTCISYSDNLPYEKVGKNEPVCIADEVPFDIPDSWEWVRLGNISIINGGYAFKSTDYISDGTRVIRISDFNENGFVNKSIVRHKFDDALQDFLIEKGNIILCMTGGTVGKSYFVKEIPEPMMTNQRVATIKILKAIEDYINLVVVSPITQKVIQDSKNSTNDNISMDTIKGFFIPLPPLPEQQRIVDKLKELEPYINDYDKAYEKIEKLNTDFPDLLKKSILQEAVQGKLVSQDPTDEPASVLIEQIRQEKEQLIKDKKIKKDKNESYIFRRDNSHYEKIGSEERCIDDEIPFDIPDSWEWCTLASVTEQIHYGYTASAAPVGDAKLARITDIQDNKIMWETVPYCSISKENLPKYKLKNRDILIARTGGTIGKTYIVRNLNENAVFASYLIRAIPLQLVNEEYLKLFMESPLYWEQLKTYSMGTGQPNVNGQSLSKLRLPIPPLNEQQRIVEYYKNILPKIKDLK